ncbi:hypothetical protein UlMin_032379 [Ulmus minor]
MKNSDDINLDLCLGRPCPEENPLFLSSFPFSPQLDETITQQNTPPSYLQELVRREGRSGPPQPPTRLTIEQEPLWQRSRSPPLSTQLVVPVPVPEPSPPTDQLTRQVILSEEIITPPFPWAKNLHAKLHDWKILNELGIEEITGQMKCNACDRQYEMSYNLRTEFRRVGRFIITNYRDFDDRAPDEWSNPVFPACNYCGRENSGRPIIPKEKWENINWLFLLLGQFIGCCNLNQLKYFCMHNEIHRTAAKDRLLFLTYLKLCKQIDPEGPFDHRCG